MPRWLLAVAGVAALVVLFLLIRPGDDEPASNVTPTPTAPSTTPTPTSTATEPTPSATATLDAVEIEVEEGRVEGPDRITVAQGDRVAIEVKSDVEDHVHVHGYDLLTDVLPDRDITITFRATIPGIFEIELEDSGLLLTQLEVTA
jgi:hypothetical protein